LSKVSSSKAINLRTAGLLLHCHRCRLNRRRRQWFPPGNGGVRALSRQRG
jgi:hypothetical protein